MEAKDAMNHRNRDNITTAYSLAIRPAVMTAAYCQVTTIM
jgi:hypothetical protein